MITVDSLKEHLGNINIYTEDEQKVLKKYFDEKGTYSEVEQIYKSSLSLINKYFGEKTPHFAVLNDLENGEQSLIMTFESGIEDINELCQKEHDFLMDLGKTENYSCYLTIGADIHYV